VNTQGDCLLNSPHGTGNHGANYCLGLFVYVLTQAVILMRWLQLWFILLWFNLDSSAIRLQFDRATTSLLYDLNLFWAAALAVLMATLQMNLC